ncbi:MAG: DUF1993 family protein [Rhodobacterales bacterium]|nr:DUF1993 family protein [Rhodobacterales bacterium]
MSHFDDSVPQLIKMLNNLNGWIDEAVAHSEAQGTNPEDLIQLKLIDDMLCFGRQIELCCDAAKFTAARLSAQEAPSKKDNETTLAELRARIAWTVDYLCGFTAADFEGAEDRTLRLSFLPEGVGVNAVDYLHEFALPNFYFHCTTAYGILRAQGVPLGKRMFIGGMKLQKL